MKVLLLSPFKPHCDYGEAIAFTITRHGDEVVRIKEDDNPSLWPRADFIVSFGWRKIIKEPILSTYYRRIINIHGSFLPFNRGAYPNLFSWVEDTPKGVSIHFVDQGVDTGPIIMRHAVDFTRAPNTTLASSYDILKFTGEEMFRKAWPVIRKQNVVATHQDPRVGVTHTIKEAEPIIARLSKGWDTPVRELQEG